MGQKPSYYLKTPGRQVSARSSRSDDTCLPNLLVPIEFFDVLVVARESLGEKHRAHRDGHYPTAPEQECPRVFQGFYFERNPGDCEWLLQVNSGNYRPILVSVALRP